MSISDDDGDGFEGMDLMVRSFQLSKMLQVARNPGSRLTVAPDPAAPRGEGITQMMADSVIKRIE